MKPFGYIYITTNKVNGMRYVGQHRINTRRRCGNYLGSGTRLRYAIRKYGVENFEKEILENCDSEEMLNERELFWISYFNAEKDDGFYNIAEGGRAGDIWSKLPKERQDKIRERIRANNKKRDYSNFKTIFSGSGNPAYGKRWYKSSDGKSQYLLYPNDEKIKKLKLIPGIPRTEEHNRKISIANKGRLCISPSSGKLCMHKNGKNTYVDRHEVASYIEDGWEIGGKRDSNLAQCGWKWMTNGSETVRVARDSQGEYMGRGYKFGRAFAKRKPHRSKEDILKEKFSKYNLRLEI